MWFAHSCQFCLKYGFTFLVLNDCKYEAWLLITYLLVFWFFLLPLLWFILKRSCLIKSIKVSSVIIFVMSLFLLLWNFQWPFDDWTSYCKPLKALNSPWGCPYLTMLSLWMVTFSKRMGSVLVVAHYFHLFSPYALAFKPGTKKKNTIDLLGVCPE